MDIDKDGTISKNDIRAAFDNVGKLMSEGELDEMLGEVGGPCTFDSMIKMFQAKMAGGESFNVYKLTKLVEITTFMNHIFTHIKIWSKMAIEITLKLVHLLYIIDWPKLFYLIKILT